MKIAYRMAFRIPAARVLLCFVKKLTVSGIIGNTQGVNKAAKPERNAIKKIVHSPLFSESSSSVGNRDLWTEREAQQHFEDLQRQVFADNCMSPHVKVDVCTSRVHAVMDCLTPELQRVTRASLENIRLPSSPPEGSCEQ